MNSLITCPAIEAVNSPKSTSASRPADGSAAPSPGTGCRRSRPSAGQQCCEPWTLQPGPLPPRSAAARSGGLYAAASAARPDPPPASAAQDQHAGPSPERPGQRPSGLAGPRWTAPDEPSGDGSGGASPAPEPTYPHRAHRVGYVQTAPLSISPSHPPPLRIALADEPKVEGNGWSRVGPHPASISPPSGAKSGWHTQPTPGRSCGPAGAPGRGPAAAGPGSPSDWPAGPGGTGRR